MIMDIFLDLQTSSLFFIIFFNIFQLIFSSFSFLFKRFQAPVSLNAAIFASVLLGSRLPSTVHVFALIFLAIILFALFPIMRHHLRVFFFSFIGKLN